MCLGRVVLLLWIFCVFFSVMFCYALVCVSLYVPCRHLLGKGWPLGSRLWCLTVSLSLSHWYPWSGVVLDCIDSWSLHPYLPWVVPLLVCKTDRSLKSSLRDQRIMTTLRWDKNEYCWQQSVAPIRQHNKQSCSFMIFLDLSQNLWILQITSALHIW